MKNQFSNNNNNWKTKINRSIFNRNENHPFSNNQQPTTIQKSTKCPLSNHSNRHFSICPIIHSFKSSLFQQLLQQENAHCPLMIHSFKSSLFQQLLQQENAHCPLIPIVSNKTTPVCPPIVTFSSCAALACAVRSALRCCSAASSSSNGGAVKCGILPMYVSCWLC